MPMSSETEVLPDAHHIPELIASIRDLNTLLSPEAQAILRDLRPQAVTQFVHDDLDRDATLGERLADRIAQLAGSWGFIGTFVFIMVIWISINMLIDDISFDPYPFILLNLGLSTLAALQAPVILMSQNRQNAKDRAHAENDYQINLKSELEIADLHRKMERVMNLVEAQQEVSQRILERLAISE